MVKVIKEWGKYYENTTERIPEPLDLSDSVNLACRLLEVLMEKNLLFYYGKWDTLKRQSWNDLTNKHWMEFFTDLRHIFSQYIGTNRRTLPEKYQEAGTRRVRPIFFIYIDSASIESQIVKKQLEALAVNSRGIYVVFVHQMEQK